MRVRTRGLWMRPAARRVQSQAAVSPPEVHLKPAGSPRRVRELGRVDRDRYAWSSVGGESKCRGRLSVTIAPKRALASAIPIIPQYDRVGKGLTTRCALSMDTCPVRADLI